MGAVVQFTGARVAIDHTRTERIDVRISRGRFLPFDTSIAPSHEYDLSGHLLLPGLINAHDHLEFNLFPRLGQGPWRNAREWAADIHRPDMFPVREHRSVPRSVRLVWGAIRNVLCGVTTVAHHNPFEQLFAGRNFPLRVVRRLGWAHSLDFSPDVVALRRKTPAGWPFVIHAAEGSDERAQKELTTLDELGLLDAQTVLVHATAATPQQLENARSRRASIVWCPSSNVFMLGKTLSSTTLRSFPEASLGTDSALTADGDLIDEIHAARKQGALTPEEIYRMVTASPARALRLKRGEGSIREGGVADLIAVRDTGQTPAEALTDLRPELVLKAGRVVLMSSWLKCRTDVPPTSGFHCLGVQSRGSFLIRAAIPKLHASARLALGSEIRLAGKLVTP